MFVRHMFQDNPDPGIDNHDVWTMNADGSNQRNLTNNLAEDNEPNWSPDGRKIAFTSDRTGSNEVYTTTRTARGFVSSPTRPASTVGPIGRLTAG